VLWDAGSLAVEEQTGSSSLPASCQRLNPVCSDGCSLVMEAEPSSSRPPESLPSPGVQPPSAWLRPLGEPTVSLQEDYLSFRIYEGVIRKEAESTLLHTLSDLTISTGSGGGRCSRHIGGAGIKYEITLGKNLKLLKEVDPWSVAPELRALADELGKSLGLDKGPREAYFDNIVVQYYPDGNAFIPPHHDFETGEPIVGLSLGATRTYVLKYDKWYSPKPYEGPKSRSFALKSG
jgi:hypothetical protein